MTYEFEYIKAIDKCEMLSSFEGRDLVGDSRGKPISKDKDNGTGQASYKDISGTGGEGS